MKTLSQEKVQELINTLDGLITKAVDYERKHDHELKKVKNQHKKSAYNLVHYLALRSEDIRELQILLGNMGISRLGKAEGHIMTSMLAIRNVLKCMVTGKAEKQNDLIQDILSKSYYPSFTDSEKINKSNTIHLLGKKPKGSRARIMVTMPTEASTDISMMHRMSQAGMNLARINCAHDGPDVWKKMIDNAKKIAKKDKKDIHIAMDLGGPKLRTGALPPGPKVIRLRPVRDDLGRIIKYPKVFIGKTIPENGNDEPFFFMPLSLKVNDFKEDDNLFFIDTRGKKCILKVTDIQSDGLWADCNKSAYIFTGMILTNKRNKKIYTVGDLPPIESSISLKLGDIMYVTSGNDESVSGLQGYGSIPSIPCDVPELFHQVKPGQKVVFDDNKIESVIREVKPNAMIVEITYVLNGAAKLRSEKGMNFPNSKLNIKGLTEKDKEDMKFVVAHADIVNMSFVNTKDDVKEIFDELKKLKREDIGIILKIETMEGFKNLPKLLLKIMQYGPVGIMLARGDLAIEVGWEKLASVQEEILRLCDAAHTPVVWATQVLENLAKKGVPSRAEISDVIMADRAACVMLNKGPHIEVTIKALESVLESIENYQNKKATLLPALDIGN